MHNFFTDYDHMGWGGGWGGYPFGSGLLGLFFAPVILLVVVWTLYWKYKALWYAAKHDDKWWFIALLIINTIGILEILYLYVFSKKNMMGHDEAKTPMVPPQM